MLDIQTKMKKNLSIFTAILLLLLPNISFAQEELTEFSEDTVSILNQELRELRDADVWERDSANSQVELIEPSALDMQSQDIVGIDEIEFEGATADDYETTFSITDPTADKTITIPDASGTVAFAEDKKLIAFTREMDAVSGDVSYTGVGFTPTAAIFFAAVGTECVSFGGSDGTDDGCSFTYDSSPSLYSYAANCIYLWQAAGKNQKAVVKTFDSDGLTLTWTRTGATAGGTAGGYFLAFR